MQNPAQQKPSQMETSSLLGGELAQKSAPVVGLGLLLSCTMSSNNGGSLQIHG